MLHCGCRLEDKQAGMRRKGNVQGEAQMDLHAFWRSTSWPQDEGLPRTIAWMLPERTQSSTHNEAIEDYARHALGLGGLGEGNPSRFWRLVESGTQFEDTYAAYVRARVHGCRAQAGLPQEHNRTRWKGKEQNKCV